MIGTEAGSLTLLVAAKASCERACDDAAPAVALGAWTCTW